MSEQYLCAQPPIECDHPEAMDYRIDEDGTKRWTCHECGTVIVLRRDLSFAATGPVMSLEDQAAVIASSGAGIILAEGGPLFTEARVEVKRRMGGGE